MSPAQEKKFLIALLKKLDQPGTGIMENRFFLPGLWLVLVIVFMSMFHLASQESVSRTILIIVAALIGTFTGWIFFYLTALKQWPVFRQHIDRATVEKRLRELET